MRTRREQLVELRKLAGYSQSELANKMGVDRSSVVRWEGGLTEPQPEQRRRLANALGVPLAELIRVLDGVVKDEANQERPQSDETALSAAAQAQSGSAVPSERHEPSRMSRKRRIAVVAAPVVVLIVIGTVASVAITRNKSLVAMKETYAGAYAEVYPSEVREVCDTQADGNGAFVTIQRADGIEQYYWDGTGHDEDCGGPFYLDFPIVQFKVCEDHAGCSAWQKIQ